MKLNDWGMELCTDLCEYDGQGHLVFEEPICVLQVHFLWTDTAVYQQVHHGQAGPATFHRAAGVN
eukprot:1160471-Pelagomonas_calceolata.AAC.5